MMTIRDSGLRRNDNVLRMADRLERFFDSRGLKWAIWAVLALAVIYDGGWRGEAAEFAGVTLQIVRDWVVKFNALGPDGLIDGKAPNPSSKLKSEQWQRLADMIEAGPLPAVDGVVRWRLVDLAQWVFEEFRVTLSIQALSENLRRMGYRKLSARPRHHTQDKDAIPAFKKISPPSWRKSKRASMAART